MKSNTQHTTAAQPYNNKAKINKYENEDKRNTQSNVRVVFFAVITHS